MARAILFLKKGFTWVDSMISEFQRPSTVSKQELRGSDKGWSLVNNSRVRKFGDSAVTELDGKYKYFHSTFYRSFAIISGLPELLTCDFTTKDHPLFEASQCLTALGAP